jgi:hypothetical protein
MVSLSRNALAFVIGGLCASSSTAFAPTHGIQKVATRATLHHMIATTPSDLGVSTPPELNPNNNDSNEGDNGRKGAMIDLTGIAFSVSQINVC